MPQHPANVDRADPAPARAPRVGYIMSRFPKITETFVLYEMAAVERLGAEVEVLPLWRHREAVSHPEAREYVERAHFEPFLSWRSARANLGWLFRAPRRYLGTLAAALWAARRSPRYLAGVAAVFPKCAYFARQAEARRLDHLHAHFASHPAAAAWMIHRLTGIPFSFTAHGSDLHRERAMLKEKTEAAAFVAAISQYNRELIRETCGPGSGTEVHVVHCGVDPTDFGDADAPDRRGEIADRPLRVLCVGTLHEVKGQRYLIEAARLLQARGGGIELHFVGDGPDRAALEARCSAAGIDHRVTFHGRRTRPEVIRWLRTADVLAAPSVPTADGRREGIPVVLMEAMAAGVPVVASRLSGIPELVIDGATGLLVAPRDAAGLASALRSLHDDAGLRRRLAAAGRLKVEAEFNLQRNAAQLLSLIKSASSPARPTLAASAASRKLVEAAP